MINKGNMFINDNFIESAFVSAFKQLIIICCDYIFNLWYLFQVSVDVIYNAPQN